MPTLKIPSLQHMVRHWRGQPEGIMRSLVALAKNPPTFNYNVLFGAVRDLLVLGQSYEQVEEGIRRGVKREDLKQRLLEVLPLIRDYFEGITPTFVQSVERRYYAVGRDLLVPFDPPIIYGVGGQLHFPWFSFWRSNPLADERLSLFVTIVEEVLLQDPDLETARFSILDFSAPKTTRARERLPRELKVIDAADIPRVSPERKAEMLETFGQGYLMAKAKLAESASDTSDKRPDAGSGMDDHPDLVR